MSLQKAKAFIRKEEGGKYVPKLGDRNNDPNPTMYGVIQKTYDRYRQRKGLALRSVYLIEEPEWDEIYTAGFWTPAGCSDLPEPLDLLVADCAFNSGPKQSVKFLQRAVGAVPDGAWGPDTKKRTLEANVREVCISVIGQRIRFLQSLYDKTVTAQAEWDAAHASGQPLRQPDGTLAPRPELFPLALVKGRVQRLQKAAGL